jgi:hypothetical protein
MKKLLNQLQLKIYLDNCKNFVNTESQAGAKIYLDFIKYYPKWLVSLQKDYWVGPLEDSRPWITFQAIDFLNKNLSKTDKVFEYGMGGSTVFFAEKVEHVFSVEHDSEWYSLVLDKINTNRVKNVTTACIESEGLMQNSSATAASDYQSYLSSHGLLFQKYVCSINNYQDNFFDLVSIDGRARPSCIQQSLSKVKPGKFLLVDNSERDHYQLAIQHLLSNWRRRTFNGPTPYLQWFTETSIWQKPMTYMNPYE